MGLHTFIRPLHMFFFKIYFASITSILMVGCSNGVQGRTHNVGERYVDRCSINERGKTKMFCFQRDIMSLVGDLTLLCFSTFFFASLNSILLVGYRDGVQECTHSVGESDVVSMREVKLKFYAFGGISYLWQGILCVFGGK